MVKSSLLLCLALCFFRPSAGAAIITFNLLDPTGVAGTAGETLEANSNFTAGGLTIGAAGVTTLGNGTGGYSASATTAGFNSGGTTADVASALDLGETLTFTLNFSGLNVSFTSFDFSGIGASAADSAFVSVAGAGPVQLFTGEPGFNGTLDLWTPTAPIVIADGDTIVVSASDIINLQAISFAVAAVPEPSSLAFLGLIAGGLVARRVRRRQAA